MLEKKFAHKKLKKLPQKVAYLWQLGVFFLCSPNCPKQPRTSFPFYKFFYTTNSYRVSACMYAFCPNNAKNKFMVSDVAHRLTEYKTGPLDTYIRVFFSNFYQKNGQDYNHD